MPTDETLKDNTGSKYADFNLQLFAEEPPITPQEEPPIDPVTPPVGDPPEPPVTPPEPPQGEKETKPTEYTDFTLPEGFQMNTEQLEAFKPYAVELGMSQEQAQKAIDMHVQGMQKAFEAEVEFRKAAYGDVVKEVTADKSIGKEGLGKINAMLTKYGGEEAKGFLDIAVLGASGLSKDAAKGLIQAMHKIALAAGDAPIITGQTQAKNIADKYPGLPQNK